MGTKKNNKKPTPKQIAYIRERVKNPTKSKKRCAISAGYSESVARRANAKIEKGCKGILLEEMERQGLTEEYLVRKLKEGLDSVETKVFASGGKIKSKLEITDYFARKQYLELAHKLRGDLVDKVEHKGEITERKVILNVGGKIEDSDAE